MGSQINTKRELGQSFFYNKTIRVGVSDSIYPIKGMRARMCQSSRRTILPCRRRNYQELQHIKSFNIGIFKRRRSSPQEGCARSSSRYADLLSLLHKKTCKLAGAHYSIEWLCEPIASAMIHDTCDAFFVYNLLIVKFIKQLQFSLLVIRTKNKNHLSHRRSILKLLSIITHYVAQCCLQGLTCQL